MFGCLGQNSYKSAGEEVYLHLPPLLEAMIALSALPSKWETITAIITNNTAMEDLILMEVCNAVILQYETETNRGQHKPTANLANANKLSAVKWKHSNPHFAQQDHLQQLQTSPSNPNQQQHRQHGSRGTGHGRKAKGKGKQCDGHSHVASVAFAALVFTTDAALPPPLTSTIVHFGASLSMVMQTILQSPPTMRTKGVYPSVNKVISLLECMKVRPTIQTTIMLEECFLKLDNEVCHCVGYYEDNYSSDEDMLWTVLGPSCEIFAATPSGLADLLGELIAHDFEYLSIDSVFFDPPSLDKENHALMLPYISPQSVVMDLGHSDPEAKQYAAEEADIAAEWAAMPKPTLKHKSSNKEIEEIWQHNQDFLACQNCVPTLELPPNFDDDLEDALDWGSDDEMKYTFSSFSTSDTNTSTILVPSSISKGNCNNMLSVKEVSKLYNVNFGVLDVLKCEHHIAYTQCAECHQKFSTMWLLDSGASVHFTNNHLVLQGLLHLTIM